MEADNDYDSNPVYLGFAEKANKNDFQPDKFNSKIGGLPTWIVPMENKIDISFFHCSCGRPLSFLLQLYCPLEDKANCFHRILYVFFCSICWKEKDLVKVLRVQLKENSSIFNGEQLINQKILENDQTIIKVNQLLKSSPCFLDEYVIETSEEKKEASKIYFKFYNNLNEKSLSNSRSSSNKNIKSKNNNADSDDESDEEEEFIEINLDKNLNKDSEKLLKEFISNNPDVDINKIESVTKEELESDKQLEGINSDIFFTKFSNVVKFDPDQIVRYYRNNYYPLWFTEINMLSVKNTKCRNCKGDIEFEFQIMPYMFSLEKNIFDIDIGTIVIYTCKNSCNNKKGDLEGEFIEEYGFIQRTGENIKRKDNNTLDAIREEKEKDKDKGEKKKKNEPDEDGFIEVKKNKGKKY